MSGVDDEAVRKEDILLSDKIVGTESITLDAPVGFLCKHRWVVSLICRTNSVGC